jgi:hypothetical protein
MQVLRSIWQGYHLGLYIYAFYIKVHKHLPYSPKSNKYQNKDMKKLKNFEQKYIKNNLTDLKYITK